MLSWLVVLLFPMIAIVQSIAASVGTSQSSIQVAIRRRYGLALALAALILVVAVNIMTLAADIEAGAESLKLLFGAQREVFVLPFALVVGWLLLTHSYARIERILSFLPLIFICYGISAILARPDWGALLHSLIVPHFDFTPVVTTGALALLGTTLTSYVYYWEQIEVSERGATPAQAPALRADAVWGAVAPAICFFFVLVATAATLGKSHASVQTATDAAIALAPLAGRWATILFAIGLLASAAHRRADTRRYEWVRRRADIRLAGEFGRARGAGAWLLRGDRWFACRLGGVGFCRLFSDRAALLDVGCRRVGNAAYAMAARRNCAQSRDHG